MSSITDRKVIKYCVYEFDALTLAYLIISHRINIRNYFAYSWVLLEIHWSSKWRNLLRKRIINTLTNMNHRILLSLVFRIFYIRLDDAFDLLIHGFGKFYVPFSFLCEVAFRHNHLCCAASNLFGEGVLGQSGFILSSLFAPCCWNGFSYGRFIYYKVVLLARDNVALSFLNMRYVWLTASRSCNETRGSCCFVHPVEIYFKIFLRLWMNRLLALYTFVFQSLHNLLLEGCTWVLFFSSNLMLGFVDNDVFNLLIVIDVHTLWLLVLFKHICFL